MNGIRIEYGWDMHEICMEYASSMHGNMLSQKTFSPPQDDHGSPKASKMAKSPNECLTNVIEDLRKIYDISWPIIEYVWDMHVMCMEYVWNMHGICMEYAWNMYGIWMEYAWNTHRM